MYVLVVGCVVVVVCCHFEIAALLRSLCVVVMKSQSDGVVIVLYILKCSSCTLDLCGRKVGRNGGGGGGGVATQGNRDRHKARWVRSM